MNKYLRLMFVLLGLLGNYFACCAMEDSRYGNAIQKGAPASITLSVRDFENNVVTGAVVHVSFCDPHASWSVMSTDTNGVVTATGKCYGEMIYYISKTGYYGTEGKFLFGMGDLPLVDGKWQPWGVTNVVVLKQIKKPVSMNAVVGEFVIPQKGTAIAFDLEMHDWVHPYGEGTHKDVLVCYDEVAPSADRLMYSKRLMLVFGTNGVDGVRIYRCDDFSEMRSVYEAPLEGYESSISLSLDQTRKKESKKELGPNEYLIFRVRSEVDDRGNVVRTHYGKIYGPVEYGLMGKKPLLKINCYFNPEVNSRNLEFDPRRNLSRQRVRLP